MAASYSHLYQLPATGLRFLPCMAPGVGPIWRRGCLPKPSCAVSQSKVFNHGRLQRDFTYIDDIVEGILRVLAQPPQGIARTRCTILAITSRWN